MKEVENVKLKLYVREKTKDGLYRIKLKWSANVERMSKERLTEKCMNLMWRTEGIEESFVIEMVRRSQRGVKRKQL